ncbi:MAG TPA: lysophospholipid acyltransferase family protein [Candidatus Bathyarchaeia archaeon]|nr:lysophospholipid acyltransferase family protein [Candidatus Bathyarchaeia archaeon]
MAPGDESSTLEILPAAELRAARPRSPRFPPLYQLIRGGCAPVLRGLFGLAISGLEHLPANGPFILAANHHNYLDGVVLGVAVPRPISFLVMPRVFHASPIHPLFHRRIGSIPVNLERPDPGAMKRTLRVLEDGGIVGIFPEGPFSREGRLVRGQPGVALMALRAGVPVVPAGISGTFEALAGRRFHIPRGRPLAVRFGHPLYFQPSRRGAGQVERAEITRRIMAHIAALLPSGRHAAMRRDEAGIS